MPNATRRRFVSLSLVLAIVGPALALGVPVGAATSAARVREFAVLPPLGSATLMHGVIDISDRAFEKGEL